MSCAPEIVAGLRIAIASVCNTYEKDPKAGNHHTAQILTVNSITHYQMASRSRKMEPTLERVTTEGYRGFFADHAKDPSAPKLSVFPIG